MRAGSTFDCFEVGSEVGGNWRYMNDNGMSSAYRSLHINTSRRMMAYATYPMPEDYPDYPNHWQIAEYFDDYVDHFGFRDRIRFRTEVTRVEPAGRGGWRVSWRERDSASRARRSTMPCSSPTATTGTRAGPSPRTRARRRSRAQQLHVHDYKTPDMLEGKRVLVLGIGNSATDVAVEASRAAERTCLAMRRGAWVLPKYLKGKPVDELGNAVISRLPLAVTRALYRQALKTATGEPTDFGLPEPDHKLLEAHPTISAELLPRIGHGAMAVKPNIAEFAGGRTVRFVDGSEEEIDLVIWCTGYKITFPFFDPGLISAPDNEIPLYRRVVSPDHPDLYFIGLLQPLGAIMPLAEAQSEWIADVLEGRVELPSAAQHAARDRP